jgi:hypothetical protein
MTNFSVVNTKNYKRQQYKTFPTTASRYYVTGNNVKIVTIMNRATVLRNHRSVSKNTAPREKQ